MRLQLSTFQLCCSLFTFIISVKIHFELISFIFGGKSQSHLIPFFLLFFWIVIICVELNFSNSRCWENKNYVWAREAFLHNCLYYCIECSLNSAHRYDPSTGIYGMDFYVVLERPGYRVGRRRRCKSRVGIQHRVTKEDAMKWFQVKYEGVILNKAQTIGGS